MRGSILIYLGVGLEVVQTAKKGMHLSGKTASLQANLSWFEHSFLAPPKVPKRKIEHPSYKIICSATWSLPGRLSPKYVSQNTYNTQYIYIYILKNSNFHSDRNRELFRTRFSYWNISSCSRRPEATFCKLRCSGPTKRYANSAGSRRLGKSAGSNRRTRLESSPSEIGRRSEFLLVDFG